VLKTKKAAMLGLANMLECGAAIAFAFTIGGTDEHELLPL
jgi:hypothetical protein